MQKCKKIESLFDSPPYFYPDNSSSTDDTSGVDAFSNFFDIIPFVSKAKELPTLLFLLRETKKYLITFCIRY